jgi:hypothetical protein
MEPIQVPSEEDHGITDWSTQGQEAAAAILNAPKKREFVNPATVAPAQRPSGSQLKHRAGDQERDAWGNKAVWVNDHCYVVSEAPPLGTPDVFARMAPTRTVCVDSGAEGQLFKDLAAYKKNHPQ